MPLRSQLTVQVLLLMSALCTGPILESALWPGGMTSQTRPMTPTHFFDSWIDDYFRT
jgi:hypothetical protein